MNKEKGQSLVELALSFLVLMFLLAGAVEFGTLFFQYVQLRDAAQEGALYGSYCQNESRIIERSINASVQPINMVEEGVDVFVEYPEAGLREGGAVKVHVWYQHRVFMPFMSTIIGDYITLKADVTDTILSTTGCS